MDLLKCLFFVLGLSTAMGDCDTPPPVIGNASNNVTGTPPYPNGYTVHYTCSIGYKEAGISRIYSCNGDNWEGGQYSCDIINCDYIQPPKNGKIENEPNYKYGSIITFVCDDGYELFGSRSLSCKSNGKWEPSTNVASQCLLLLCPEFENVNNGTMTQVSRNGIRNSVGSVTTVTCSPTTVLHGTRDVTCDSTGQWGSKPTCEPSTCKPYPTNSSCVKPSPVENNVYSLSCVEGQHVSVTRVGPNFARCINNRWSDLTMACYCDCKITPPESSSIKLLNTDSRGFLKHKHNLHWDCLQTFSYEAKVNFVCLDGKLHRISGDNSDEMYQCNIHKGILAVVVLTIVCSVMLMILCILFRKELPCFSKRSLTLLDSESTNHCRGGESEFVDVTESTGLLNKDKDIPIQQNTTKNMTVVDETKKDQTNDTCVNDVKETKVENDTNVQEDQIITLTNDADAKITKTYDTSITTGTIDDTNKHIDSKDDACVKESITGKPENDIEHDVTNKKDVNEMDDVGVKIKVNDKGVRKDVSGHAEEIADTKKTKKNVPITESIFIENDSMGEAINHPVDTTKRNVRELENETGMSKKTIDGIQNTHFVVNHSNMKKHTDISGGDDLDVNDSSIEMTTNAITVTSNTDSVL